VALVGLRRDLAHRIEGVLPLERLARRLPHAQQLEPPEGQSLGDDWIAARALEEGDIDVACSQVISRRSKRDTLGDAEVGHADSVGGEDLERVLLSAGAPRSEGHALPLRSRTDFPSAPWLTTMCTSSTYTEKAPAMFRTGLPMNTPSSTPLNA